MAVIFDFVGDGTAESAAMIGKAGNIVRVRVAETVGSAKLQAKIIADGITTLVDIDEFDLWESPARPEDVISIVYNGQGNPASRASGIIEEEDAGSLDASTREYAPSNGYHIPVGASPSILPLAGNLALAASREVRLRASTSCWVRFATAGTGQDASRPFAPSATSSMPLDANQPEVLRIPANCTHISAIRDTVDGTLTLTPVA